MRDTLDLDLPQAHFTHFGATMSPSATPSHVMATSGWEASCTRMADAAPQQLRVVAIYRRPDGLGDIVLPHALALQHAAAALDRAVFVSGPGQPPVARALHAIVDAVPTAVLLTRGQYLAEVRAQGSAERGLAVGG